MNIKAIIFDMDGVLIDSEPQYQREIIECLKEKNITITLDTLKPLAGGTDLHFRRVLGPILEKENISMSLFDDLLQDYAKRHLFTYDSILNPGVHQTLKELKEQGILLALASSSPRKHIDRIINECKLDTYFQFTISGEIFQESKPHPEIYLSALHSLHMNAQNVIAVEDSTYGIQAAKGAGLFCIAKRDERYDYKQYHADYIIDEIPELLSFLSLKQGE